MEEQTTMEKEQDHKTQWREINTNVWKPEKEGDVIIGQLVRKVEGKEEASSKYYLELEGGRVLFLWGSAILDDRLALVQVGMYVRVTYEGKAENRKGQPLNMYKVEVAESL